MTTVQTAAAPAGQPRDPVWQPTRDAPLFPGEILAGRSGIGQLDEPTLTRIRAYLAEVVATRGFPLHVNVIWNALHYGYDTTTGGYDESVLRLDAFDLLTADRAATVPVGAMATMPAGTPVWVETIHTEIDDPAFDADGDLPAVCSGAPATAGMPVRLVFDADAFGDRMPEQRAALQRLARRGVLDRYGHMTAAIPVGTDLRQATATTAQRYARWLLAGDRERLAGGPVTAALPGADADTLLHAVTASLEAVAALLADTPGVSLTGEYATPTKARCRLNDSDLADITSTICRAGRAAVRYTGAGAAIRALPADRDLTETRYLAALVETTRALQIQATTAACPVDVRLRLDDADRGGGVWRAAGADVPDGAADTSPLIPLGLGYAQRTAPVGPEPHPPVQEHHDIPKHGNTLMPDVDASHTTFTVVLRVRHLADGLLPLTTAVATQIGNTPGPLGVRIAHPGVDLADDEAFHEPVTLTAPAPAVSGICYPLAFYPGLMLNVTVTAGGRIIDAVTDPLPDPVNFSGTTITHATDLTILAAFCGLPDPGNPSPEATARQTPAGSTEGDDKTHLALLLRTMHRTVPEEPDGTRTFTAAALAATTYAGLPAPAYAATRAARLLDAHASAGQLLRLPGQTRYLGTREGFAPDPPTYLWWPQGTAAPVHRQPSWTPPALLRPHHVPVTLRKLPEGWSPSPSKLAGWPALRAALGPAYLPTILPPGYTWVEAHERGKDPGWQSAAVRTTPS
jgi:hypothetical protein